MLGADAVVTLSATPAAGSHLASWSGGGCSGTTATCVLTLSAAATVTATFAPNPPTPSPTPVVVPDVATVGHASVSGDVAKLAVTCTGSSGTTCSVKLALSVTETLKGSKIVSISKVKTKKKTVAVGSASVVVDADATQTVSITLDGIGKQLLKSHSPLATALVVTQLTTPTNTVVGRQTVTFRKAKKKKH